LKEKINMRKVKLTDLDDADGEWERLWLEQKERVGLGGLKG